MKAKLTFTTRQQAERFAISWGRFSMKGHTIGSGLESVTVSLDGVTEECKTWIDGYVSKLNQKNQ